MCYFLIKNKIIEDITTEKSILQFRLDEMTTGSYYDKTYYITENKEYAIIEINGFSENTGKGINETKIKKINNATIEKYIEKLEEYIELNSLEDIDFLNITRRYYITYKGQNIIVPADYEFFEETKELLDNIY